MRIPKRASPIYRDARLTLACIALALAGCGGGQRSLTDQQAVDAAWQALEPHTSSHNRANWEAVTVEQTTGQDVSDDFEGEPAPGCPPPELPANAPIGAATTYWYVLLKPLAATPLAQAGEPSPTAPPLIPEPFVREARFLLDAGGAVAARKLSCVIY